MYFFRILSPGSVVVTPEASNDDTERSQMTKPTGDGTKTNPWKLKTPPGTSEFGKTQLNREGPVSA